MSYYNELTIDNPALLRPARSAGVVARQGREVKRSSISDLEIATMRPGDTCSFTRDELATVWMRASSADCDPYPWFQITCSVLDPHPPARWVYVRGSSLVRASQAVELYNKAVLWAQALRPATAAKYAGWFSRHRGPSGGQVEQLARIPHRCAVCSKEIAPGGYYLRLERERFHADYRDCIAD